MNKQDILIFMSDQHGGLYTSIGGNEIVRTSNIERIANDGVSFNNAYTASPLCVPARSSFLTGQNPSKTKIFDNKGALPEDKATFLHNLAIEGYETVLCGRMHFLGHNQRHGFSKRIIGDFTITNWGEKTQFLNEQGDFQKTLSHIGCDRVVGGGDSPVLEYDRAVIKAAIDYLKEDHDKPQCIVVGTYAPHFSYVAPENLYQEYKGLVDLPESRKNQVNYRHPLGHATSKKLDDDHVKNIRAAYFGMITNLDKQVGEVYDAFNDYKKRNKKEGIFIYTSDHGDQIGERDIYGKMTHYEGSSKIPMVFSGDGLLKNIVRNGPVSLNDIGVTLCDMTNAMKLPNTDGISIKDSLISDSDNLERSVVTEFIRDIKGDMAISRSIRKGDYKLITYKGYEDYDLLFNIRNDRYELNNIKDEFPKIYKDLHDEINKDWDVENIEKAYYEKAKNHKIINLYGDLGHEKFTSRRSIDPASTVLPKIK